MRAFQILLLRIQCFPLASYDTFNTNAKTSHHILSNAYARRVFVRSNKKMFILSRTIILYTITFQNRIVNNVFLKNIRNANSNK